MKPALAVAHFDTRLRKLGNAERAIYAKAYMKSALRFHGVTTPLLNAECAAFCKASPDLTRDALIAIARALFATDVFELRSVAIELLQRKRALLRVSDVPWLVTLARTGACWAFVDDVVTQVIGPVLEGDASLAKRTRSWAKDRDFWVRRVALLAQLGPLRRGEGDFALFEEIAAPMLEETEFFIRKAIGWVLREVSKKRPALVRDFLMAHGARASGVTWREAVKYLPAAMKSQVERARG